MNTFTSEHGSLLFTICAYLRHLRFDLFVPIPSPSCRFCNSPAHAAVRGGFGLMSSGGSGKIPPRLRWRRGGLVRPVGPPGWEGAGPVGRPEEVQDEPF